MSEVLEVAVRDSRGKLRNRRLRRDGQLPAVLYGHGKDSLSLAVPTEQLEATLRHGAQVVKLKGAADGQALLQDIHWDVFQQNVLHVDLLRVDASDRVTIEVSLVLRGEAPGEREGGVVEQLTHQVEIETSPAAIPESLHLNVNDLHIHGELKASDIEDLPADAKFVGNLDKILVHCIEPVEIPDEEDVIGEAEPEVIGQKEGEEESKAE